MILHETLILHCLLKDDVLYSIKHLLQVSSISSTGQMSVDCLVTLVSARVLILFLDVVGSSLEIASTVIVWESNIQISLLNLFLEEIHLVQEEDD